MNKGEKIISTTPTEALADDVLDEPAEAGTEVESRPLRFLEKHHGDRLDRVLADLVPEFSRSYLAQLIEAGAVTIRGAAVTKPSQKVKALEDGVIELAPTPQSQAFQPEDIALDVVFEDPHLLVINKPAGLVVHPAPGNWSGTLLNGLLGRDAGARMLPRAGIVHRLDKDTSGLMVVARTRQAMDALVAAIAARDVHRQYLSLAHRPWTGPKERHVDAAIGRDPRNRLRMAAVDLQRNSGKPARTDLKLLDNGDDSCFVQCTLHSGRTHQIRVHMASIGHPLVGDTLYGGAPAHGMQRQALHAFRLAFAHPVTGHALAFVARLPQDIRSAIDGWGLRYNES